MNSTAEHVTQRGGILARWPAGLAVIALLVLLVSVPRSVRVLPEWALYATAFVVLLPMFGAGLRLDSARWRRAEHAAMMLFFFVAVPSNFAALATLMVGIVHGEPELTGLELLVASSMLWVTNVVIFALIFWHVDAGGPHARAGTTRPDWLFPQYGMPVEIVPAGWRPAFIDYLYLALSTATAFSTTDVTPLTGRAKRLMMIEIAVSLVTIVVVGARAVNILGS